MKKFRIKPIIFMALLVISCIAIGFTAAYIYSEVVLPNQFKTMTYNIQMEEDYAGTWGDKKVYIVNEEETNTPVVLRINYNETWGNGVNNLINGTNVVNKVWTSTFTNDFILGDDGWYYYKKVLNPESRIQILESISRNNALINSADNSSDYIDANYHLDFNFEAIQATENAVLDIWGKTITIEGDNVIWNT